MFKLTYSYIDIHTKISLIIPSKTTKSMQNLPDAGEFSEILKIFLKKIAKNALFLHIFQKI